MNDYPQERGPPDALVAHVLQPAEAGFVAQPLGAASAASHLGMASTLVVDCAPITSGVIWDRCQAIVPIQRNQ